MVFTIILRGPAGSGKTTIAQKLKEIYKAEHIAVDKIKHDLKLKHSEKEKLEANKEVIKKASKCLIENKIVIIEEVFYYKSQLKELIERLPGKKFVFSLQCPLEICLKRNVERRKSGKRKMSDEDVITVHKLVKELKEGIKINSYEKNEKETLQDILTYLPQAI